MAFFFYTGKKTVHNQPIYERFDGIARTCAVESIELRGRDMNIAYFFIAICGNRSTDTIHPGFCFFFAVG